MRRSKAKISLSTGAVRASSGLAEKEPCEAVSVSGGKESLDVILGEGNGM